MMVAEAIGLDQKAVFLRIFHQYGPALKRLAGAYAVTRQDREDLMQEIAAALWQALPRYRQEASERTWLYRIAHNVAISTSFKLRQRGMRELPEVSPDLVSADAGAEQNVLVEERQRMLLAAIRDLGAPDRQITMLHLEGLSGAEISEITGLAEGAVATRLTRIREKLRKAVRAGETCDAG